jgi:hypothetical protein
MLCGVWAARSLCGACIGGAGLGSAVPWPDYLPAFFLCGMRRVICDVVLLCETLRCADMYHT